MVNSHLLIWLAAKEVLMLVIRISRLALMELKLINHF